MTTLRLTDAQWDRIYPFLRDSKHVNDYGAVNMRQFVDAVFWIMRTGAQWRVLPTEYGNWNSVYKRFSRWCEAGVWERLLAYIANDPDLEALQIDSTSIRAHPSAAGATAKKRGKVPKP